jgi:hypothetical protein
MGRTFVVSAIVVLLLAGAWLVFTPATPLSRPAPGVLNVGDAFEGSPELPKSRIDQVLNAARARVAADNHTGNRFRLAARIMGWLSFLLTSIIALVAGAQGVSVAPGAVPDAATLALLAADSKRRARQIGLLAAAAAVLTAASGRAEAEAAQFYASADAVQREAVIARKGIVDAPNADEAISVLDGLQATITRH